MAFWARFTQFCAFLILTSDFFELFCLLSTFFLKFDLFVDFFIIFQLFFCDFDLFVDYLMLFKTVVLISVFQMAILIIFLTIKEKTDCTLNY